MASKYESLLVVEEGKAKDEEATMKVNSDFDQIEVDISQQ